MAKMYVVLGGLKSLYCLYTKNPEAETEVGPSFKKA